LLAKSGKLPTRGAWAYEVKWDDFRAIVSTEGPLRVRSRRGWNMTEHVGWRRMLPSVPASAAAGRLVWTAATAERICRL
jgi:ATP-dependent DNA ligase